MRPPAMFRKPFSFHKFLRSKAISAAICAAFLPCAKIHAQIEFLGFAGTSHYSGDIGSGFDIKSPDFSALNFSSTRLVAGLGIRAFATTHWAFRGNIYAGKISGDDKYTDNIPRRNRNLSFFSPLVGANGLIEYHFALRSGAPKRFYLLSGFDVFHFNPKTKYKGDVVYLQPLGTEGQYFMQDKAPYSLYASAFAAGGGINIYYGNRGHLSLEISGHRTFTDYLDDVSTTYPDKTALLTSNGQEAVDLSDRNLGLIPNTSDPGAIRGNPKYKDNYYFVVVCYSYAIGGTAKSATGYRRSGGRGFKSRCFDF